MSPVSPEVLQSLVSRFSTDEFYLWTVNHDRSTDSYTFHFSHQEDMAVVVTATTEELHSYRKPEWAMLKALQYASTSNRLLRFVGRNRYEFRFSELIAAMPLSRQPAKLLHAVTESPHGPTEAMLEASYRV